jgi:RHS repeat-associated protein
MYVPIGGFGAGSAAGAVQRLLFEGNVVKSFTTIPTPHAVNACASNWVTGQTVCTSDLTDVYVIQGTTLVATLTDGALGTITFSGGPTQSSGVVIDATTNTAVIGVSAPAPGGIASGGFQLLDLDTNTFSAPMTNGRDSVSGFGLLPSEAFVIDPTRHFVLSASEDSGDIQLVPYQSGPPPSLSAPFDNWNFAPYVYEGQNLGYQSWDSTAEDCTTGIGLAGTEENGANVTLVDTTQATFTSGTPKGTWSAPTSTTNFTELGATFGGLTGITVISEQHQALMFTAEGGSGGATLVAVQLPSTAGYGTPAPVDWADILNTFDSSGSPFNIGSDPHPGTTGYVDPKTGHSLVVLLSGTGKYITVDLQLLLDAPRQPGSHFVDPSYDLYLHGVLSYGAYCSGFDTKSDPNNCGGCDVVCPAGANALAVCSAAVCGIACQAGFADCANTHTACATNVETDLANCGSCGTNCNVPNSVGACNGGQCSFTCNAGYNDCDGNASNGCETLGACVAPTVGVSGPTSAVVGVVSYYSATATDTGRPLTYAWTQTSGPSPADFGTPSALTTTVDFLAPGTYVLQFEATDGLTTSAATITVDAIVVNQAPVVTMPPTLTLSGPTTTTITASATDDGYPTGATLTGTWTSLGGPAAVTFAPATVTGPEPGPLNATTQVTFPYPGTYALQLDVGDGQLDGVATTNVTVGAPVAALPGTAPTVSIGGVTDDQEVTKPVAILGTVSDGAWVLEMRLGGRDDVNTPWTVMASGTGAINAANIATFDPTLLLNGIYTVRLTSQNSVGSTATSVSLSVDARMKIGNFTLTFTDLTVQVGRLPLTITRTYDSRDKTLGDFGYGWKLGITDVRVEKSGKIGAYWIQQFIDQGLLAQFCLYPTQAASVAITFPSGRQYRFVPQASPQCQYQAPLTAADITWVSTSDPTDPTIQLVAEGSNSVTTNDTTSLNDGSTYTQLVTNALDDIYDPRDFTLTIEDGSVWHVNQDSGVSSVTTLQGDKLTITPAGILHSSGKQVTFTRDAQNRITTITDPAGNSMSYAFDASGDLASYDDRASNVTQFAYADDHYLTQIQDPLGRLPVRNDYDSSGRLISTTDATGAVVHYTPNLAANQEQVTDRLGHVTLYTYDDYGDITQKVDATGAVWNYTVDPRGNVLTTTDPLGRTTTSTFNGLDLPLTQTDALGHTTTNTYTFFKTLASTTDPLGHITTNNWDGLGRMIGSIDPLGNETHDTYDPNGGANLLASADALGNTTQYVYDSFNHVIQQTDPLGNQVTYTYDANGNKTTQSLNRNNYNGQGAPVQTTYAYDPNGRLLSTTTTSAFGASGTTSTTYTPTGKRATSTDADGRVTTYLYDALDRLITTEYPDGTITSQTYDAENHRISSTDANGNTTQYTYDQVGRLVRTTYADGSASSTVYDAAGQAIQNIDARGNVSWTAYDAAGRRISTTSPTGSTTTYAYDADGNQTTVTDALGHTTTTTYDADNHAVATTYADGNADATQYDPDGRVSLRIDTLGRITRYAYDTKGQLTSVTDALGHTTTYAYDQTGARVSQTDANRHTTDFIYDYVTGVETLRVLPDGTSQSHASDPAGQITQRIDYNGKKTTYAYDPRGKLLSRTYPDSSVVSFTYTPTGQRATETDARGTTTYGYDVRNRLVALTYPDGRKLTYGYDGAGNRTSITAKIGGNSLTTSTAYDASGRPMTVTDPLNRAYQMTYDADDGPATLSYPNGIQTTYAYDPRHRLTNLTTTQPSTNTTVASFAYTLNSEGERTQLVEADGTVRQYGYDSISRLTTETVTGSLAYANAFTYDSVGNRLTQTTTGSGAASVTYGYDSRDRLTTENNTTYGYDNDGNVTSKAGEASYAWDFENRLTEVTLNGGAVVGHVYDADGNRVQTSVTPSGGSATVDNYLVDTAGCPSCGGGGGLSQVVAESDGSGNITAVYVRDGDELLEVMRPGTSPGTWTTRFIHHDGLGSVRALTDETGTTTDARDYEAFGTKNVEAGGDPLTYGFAGEQFQSDSMLAYHRARWMDARVGRFEGMDPQDGLIRVPSTFHRYVYAADTPVNAVDPSGREYDMVSIGAAVVGFGILATTAVADTKISPGPDQRTSNWYVDVRSTPVDVSLLFDHLFLVVGEPGAAAGEQYETEYGAGASQGLFGSLSPGSLGGNGFSNQFAYGPIQAYASLYHGPPNQAPDWDTDAPRVQVASGQSQVEQANQCFVDAMNDINAAKITYDPLDSNSNRYVRTLLQRCNLPLLTPGTNTPGFQQPPF